MNTVQAIGHTAREHSREMRVAAIALAGAVLATAAIWRPMPILALAWGGVLCLVAAFWACRRPHPGVMLSMEALSSRGAQLPKFELRRPRSAIGRNTVEAMQSGAVYGFAGQVDRIVEKLTEALEEEPVVIATGGLASAIVEECHTINHHEPWLTLSGLRIIWDRNT